MILQLAFATTVAWIAWMVSRLRMTASSRFFVLSCGLASFAVPVSPLRAAIAALFPSAQVITMLVPSAILATAPPAATSSFPPATAAMAISCAISFVLIAFTIVRTIRVSRRLRDSAAIPSAREREALGRVVSRLRMRTSPFLLRSSASAPCLLGIFRPTIVLPIYGCDDFSGDELDAVIAHECAHALRRDNLFALIERTLEALYWFHPMIWLLRRDLTAAREEACDEYAAAISTPDVVVSAIARLSDVSLHSPAIVSCAAGANLTERIEHMTHFDVIRRTAPPHRLVVTVALSFLAAVTGIAATVAAAGDQSAVPRYLFTYSMTRADSTLRLSGKIVDTETAKVVDAPDITFAVNQTAKRRSTEGDLTWTLDIADKDGATSAVLEVFRDGTLAQRTRYALVATPEVATKTKYSGDPISLDLKDADLRDVLDTFHKLTKIEFVIDPDVNGKVTISAANIPWDEMLDRIISGAGYRWNVEGRKLHVHK